MVVKLDDEVELNLIRLDIQNFYKLTINWVFRGAFFLLLCDVDLILSRIENGQMIMSKKRVTSYGCGKNE